MTTHGVERKRSKSCRMKRRVLPVTANKVWKKLKTSIGSKLCKLKRTCSVVSFKRRLGLGYSKRATSNNKNFRSAAIQMISRNTSSSSSALKRGFSAVYVDDLYSPPTLVDVQEQPPSQNKPKDKYAAAEDIYCCNVNPAPAIFDETRVTAATAISTTIPSIGKATNFEESILGSTVDQVPPSEQELENVDQRAELFIANFHREMRLQSRSCRGGP